jgi:hypothetical protein
MKMFNYKTGIFSMCVNSPRFGINGDNWILFLPYYLSLVFPKLQNLLEVFLV